MGSEMDIMEGIVDGIWDDQARRGRASLRGAGSPQHEARPWEHP